MRNQILEECGLNHLDKEQRLRKAYEILHSNDIKQDLCHRIIGASFKDIERAMKHVIAERQPTREEQEELELMELAPEKFALPDPVVERPHSDTKYRTYTPEEVQELLKDYVGRPTKE